MAEPYDLTNITAANNIYEMGTATNNLSDGTFGLLLVFSVFIITFGVSSKWGFKPAFASSSFITAGVTVLIDRKSTRLNSSHNVISRMPSSA